MSRDKRNAEAEASQPAQPAQAGPAPNFTLTYRRNHPGNRCSYGIAGNSGIVVFDEGLFAPGVTPPATIVLDCEMVQPKADNKELKAQQAAAKLAEKAAKAQARIEEAQRKAAERKAKADEALAKAKAKVDAAAATK